MPDRKQVKDKFMQEPGKRKTKSWWQWLLLVVILAGIYLWQTRDLLDTGSQVNTTALPLLAGGSAPLIEAQDKPTLIYFFAPWCQICSLSIGNLDDLDSRHINIKKVAMDYASLENVWKFVKDHQVQGDVLLGHEGLKQQFRIYGYPTYYILDKDAKVVARDMGYSSGLGLRVRQWLAAGR
ncbi:TlpA family protein disulfide reductase [Lacimicrobium alkaliphilum]|uniref:Protein disulfide oxidoreductase n=1 Tax=Lacimicrobium alkaliphilum TaxID=1526571 RepID=A0ABQ1RDJ0_9ALTE|nr:redoxin domain-containing protein [Lacimicrobium alkaliphilum]GGD64273.1 protein disulfide oxidoreductase [Lacimicrobium alkaliphilum]